ncbi:Signal peptidase I [Baekduia alba]|uniref:signal peptidase I n=1 Tax=Baekduia alba TaxID=2997333 RepID=UPI002340C60D|nr:signal peptidase I [Baekduia alba]WCB96166.1 Signal peptidase I [Baekduia alba]
MLQRARHNTLVETIFLLVVAVAVAILLQAFAIKPYKIPSGSMEPTLHIHDRVLVDRFSKRVLGREPKIGDIVVFHPPHGADFTDQSQCGTNGEGEGTPTPCSKATPEQSSQSFIKRVVALGGDTISVRNGHVIRNGKQVSEPFTAPCTGEICDFPKTITIPKGAVYMMGDNRGNSDDSRLWGPVPLDWVVGKAFATYWPPSRIGGAG